VCLSPILHEASSKQYREIKLPWAVKIKTHVGHAQTTGMNASIEASRAAPKSLETSLSSIEFRTQEK